MKRKVYVEVEPDFIFEGVVLKYIPILGIYKVIYRNYFKDKCRVSFVFPYYLFDRN